MQQQQQQQRRRRRRRRRRAPPPPADAAIKMILVLGGWMAWHGDVDFIHGNVPVVLRWFRTVVHAVCVVHVQNVLAQFLHVDFHGLVWMSALVAFIRGMPKALRLHTQIMTLSGRGTLIGIAAVCKAKAVFLFWECLH